MVCPHVPRACPPLPADRPPFARHTDLEASGDAPSKAVEAVAAFVRDDVAANGSPTREGLFWNTTVMQPALDAWKERAESSAGHGKLWMLLSTTLPAALMLVLMLFGGLLLLVFSLTRSFSGFRLVYLLFAFAALFAGVTVGSSMVDGLALVGYCKSVEPFVDAGTGAGPLSLEYFDVGNATFDRIEYNVTIVNGTRINGTLANATYTVVIAPPPRYLPYNATLRMNGDAFVENVYSHDCLEDQLAEITALKDEAVPVLARAARAVNEALQHVEPPVVPVDVAAIERIMALPMHLGNATAALAAAASTADRLEDVARAVLGADERAVAVARIAALRTAIDAVSNAVAVSSCEHVRAVERAHLWPLCGVAADGETDDDGGRAVAASSLLLLLGCGAAFLFLSLLSLIITARTLPRVVERDVRPRLSPSLAHNTR